MAKTVFYIIIMVIIFFLVVACSRSVYKDLNAEEAKEMMDTNSALQLLDVREQWEYDSGHIDGSVLIPLGELSDRIDELDKEAPVLLICRTDNRSGQAGGVLVKEGFKEVYNLIGGVTGWPYGLVN